VSQRILSFQNLVNKMLYVTCNNAKFQSRVARVPRVYRDLTCINTTVARLANILHKITYIPSVPKQPNRGYNEINLNLPSCGSFNWDGESSSNSIYVFVRLYASLPSEDTFRLVRMFTRWLLLHDWLFARGELVFIPELLRHFLCFLILSNNNSYLIASPKSSC